MIFPSSVRQAVSKVTPDVQILWIHNLIEKQYGMLEQATTNRRIRQSFLQHIKTCGIGRAKNPRSRSSSSKEYHETSHI